MRKKEQACQVWKDICENCKKENEYFAGVTLCVWKETLPYVKMCDLDCDKFSIATLSKDIEAINQLYNNVNLSNYQKQEIENLLKTNKDLLLTLNPFVLQEKYAFLKPYINELTLDVGVQDRLLSLDDYELYIVKKIVDLALSYGINSNNIVAAILYRVGRSSNPFLNNEDVLEKISSFFNLIKEYEKENVIDDDVIGNIGFALISGIFPNNIEELKDFNGKIKEMLLDGINLNDDIDDLKDKLLNTLFLMDLLYAEDFIKGFDIEGLSPKLILNEGIIELSAIKMIVECQDIDKLKEIVTTLINTDEFKINLFNFNLIEENLLLIYAKEFNKCKPDFNESNLLTTIDGINIYDSGNQFYSIAKVFGAFSGGDSGKINYSESWNNGRYRSHINAVSLIRNDNLAFAEQDGKIHIKLGFSDFNEKMFLGGGTSDVNSTPDSRDMLVKIYSKLCFPDKFIDNTREWHNELDYERRNLDTKNLYFKKNPDYIILDQECEDMSQLSIDEQEQFEEYKNNTIRVAKEFGNLPVLVINRERIARNETDLIKTMLDDYNVSGDFNLLKKIIIKFNNNRNGCRGPQHKYIREKYFSNDYFQEILNEIDGIIPDNQRDLFYEFVASEYKKMSNCSYDKTTLDIPTKPNALSKRGGLNV